MYYYGRNGIRYNLGVEIKRGGEGIIYQIEGRSDLLAKVYHQQKLNSQVMGQNTRSFLHNKIITMLDQPVDYKIGGYVSIAWPVDLLKDQHNNFVGYVMPKAPGNKTLIWACREYERMILFDQKYNWHYSITVAYNLSLVVRKLHENNVIVGDFNQLNIMVDSKGRITIVDADSFNIVNKSSGREYKCTVGIEEVLAPELQGLDLSKPYSKFTKQTDTFSLAIHIFTLLMNNNHPFGLMDKVHSSKVNNQKALNIVRGNCKYVSNESSYNDQGIPDYKMLPLYIRQLFDRVFKYNQANYKSSQIINNRPTALEWEKALYRLSREEFTNCKINKNHSYLKNYGHCPWCDMNKPKKHKRFDFDFDDDLTTFDFEDDVLYSSNDIFDLLDDTKNHKPVKQTTPKKKKKKRIRNSSPLFIINIIVGILTAVTKFSTYESLVAKSLFILFGMYIGYVSFWCFEDEYKTNFVNSWRPFLYLVLSSLVTIIFTYIGIVFFVYLINLFGSLISLFSS